MAKHEALYRARELNELASKANSAGYQLYKLLQEPKPTQSGSYRRALEGGIEVCRFLSESLNAALKTPVEFNQLGFLAMLKPVREDLEKLDTAGLKGLKESAELTIKRLEGLLSALEKDTGISKPEAEEAHRFFAKITAPFLRVATSLLMHASA